MSVRLDCARCAKPFVEVTLEPDTQPERWMLRRTGWMGTCTKYGNEAGLRPLFELMRDGKLAEARGADADFLAFHCFRCDRSYCQSCWRMGPPEFDDGFYDCTMGTCPEGHEQMVDD